MSGLPKPIPTEIIDKVMRLKSIEFEIPKIDGKKIGSSYVNEIIGVSKDGLLQLVSKDLFVQDNFVCWGGVCYNPSLCLGAENTQQVVEAWNWFTKQLKIDRKVFVSAIEEASIIEWIHFGLSQLYMPKIINLAVDLFRLNELGVNISMKIHEINKYVIGNFKKASHLKKGLAMRKHMGVGHYLADLAAETRIALAAKLLKYDVKLHKAHDVMIDGLNVQVKYVRRTRNPLTIYNAIEDGFQHDAKIVAVSYDIPLDLESFVKTANGKFWGQEISLYEAIDTSIEIVAKGRIIVFFTGVLHGYLARIVII